MEVSVAGHDLLASSINLFIAFDAAGLLLMGISLAVFLFTSRRSARDRRELLFAHEASGIYVCTRELTHLESHPFLSLANRAGIGERYGYMSMVV